MPEFGAMLVSQSRESVGILDAFERARRGEEERRLGESPETGRLASELAALCARGRAGHPELALNDESFASHLARCGADLSAPDLHVEDLFLACACLQRVPRAVERLQERCRPLLERSVRRFGTGQCFVDDVEQRLWDGLLVDSTSGPRLATYAGAGALERWIGISAQRIALMVIRHEAAEGRAIEVAARSRFLPQDPELEAIKDRYRGALQRAVDAAIDAMDAHEKMLYRMHLVEGLTLDQIAKAYGVHHTTILRRLRAASARVLEETKRLLKQDLQLCGDEFDSLVRLLVSQLDLDISRVLGHPVNSSGHA
jgi:RNA polymerase sigma-70 factor (ECF subfamily)